jgi:hypothetical protein
VTAKYLLPCSCGQQVVIEPRQAGETIPCFCGAPLQVPTLLDMAALDPAPPELAATPPAPTWGWKHRLQLSGVVLLLLAIILGVLLHFERPIAPFDTINPEQLQQDARKLTPSRTWDIWEMMKQGLDRRTDQKYADAMFRFRVWQAAVAGVALCGIAMIVASVAGIRD